MRIMKSGKAISPDDIPVEVWRCLGEKTVDFLIGLFNKILESESTEDSLRNGAVYWY